MKNNTEELKNYLYRALTHSPNDFALQEVKILINKAIGIVENIEKKRNIREVNQVKKKNLVQNGFGHINTLKIIDKELNDTMIKLEQIKNRRNLPKIADSDEENNELQNVFG